MSTLWGIITFGGILVCFFGCRYHLLFCFFGLFYYYPITFSPSTFLHISLAQNLPMLNEEVLIQVEIITSPDLR
jgi:hypothetical protein